MWAALLTVVALSLLISSALAVVVTYLYFFASGDTAQKGFPAIKRLAERATELFKEAATLANCSTPEKLEASLEPGGRLHPAFGQVIISPRPR